ncbi:MAG: type I-E CRISPR-associated protein Cas7/Cse4/CasC [Clostridia bacterium]|nr:type I-E CRISPR-associated protein Cas7/Cse4/CasC [Clostridia bacterium]
MSKFIDLHVLQTVPPSCINRDDTGSPKTAVYGGVVRARVSSQAWKHAIREAFPEHMPEFYRGSRTKQIIPMVTEQIEKIAKEQGITVDNPEKLARTVLTAAKLTVKDDKQGTDALFFMSDGQARAVAELALKGGDAAKDKKAAQEALMSNPSVDMALFGRMVADDKSLNYDAAAQVAHAISTHGVHTEYDYFTAVDDRSKEDSSGAGHIGTVEFTSSTMYRYATLNVTELNESVGHGLDDAVTAFVKAFIHSMPTGKQNTFANRTLPDMVYVTIRDDQPVNLSGAYEKAVRKGNDGYVTASIERLAQYAETVYTEFAAPPEAAFVIGADIKGAKRVNEPELLTELKKIAEAYRETGGGH